MTRLILLRHGESEANEKHIFAGWTDIPLTARGHEQAEVAAAYLTEHYPINRVYTSDLKRAAQTAEHTAAKLGIIPIPDKSLREIYGGLWEKCYFDDIAEKYPDDFLIWRHDIGNARCTGGESFSEVQARTLAAIRRIAQDNPGQTVLVATHATVVRSLVCALRGITADDAHTLPWAVNASATFVEFEDRKDPVVTEYGHSAYLERLTTYLPPNV